MSITDDMVFAIIFDEEAMPLIGGPPVGFSGPFVVIELPPSAELT